MITVVTLHWKRTENTHKVIASLKNSRLVNDVIVWNNNPDVHFTSEPWVRVVNTSQDFTLNTRFAAALFAKNDTILTLDDDNLIPEDSIKKLYEAWKASPEIIHTLDGRRPTEQNEYAHDVFIGNPAAITEAQMSMTRCAMYKKEYAALYFVHAPKIRGAMEHSACLGNGEDILLSYIVRSIAKKLHKVYRIPRTELPATNAIHHRTGHKEFRTQLMRKCQEYFNIV